MPHKPSICTVSLGRCNAGHSLPRKLDMAAKYGFKGIELFYDDLVDFAAATPYGTTAEGQVQAAKKIRRLCEARHLTIICLQPFLQYGGLLNRLEHQQKLSEIRLWLCLAKALQTDLIMLPTSTLPPEKVTDMFAEMVNDYIEIADLGLRQQPPVRFALEALCWGTRVNTWEDSWQIIRSVNRPNFGICLDTFNIAGRIYGDPTAHSGTLQDAESAIMRSMKLLSSTVDVDKLFLVQIADAEKLEQPLNSRHKYYDASQPPRMSWSRNARLFYGETNRRGYLPIKTILDTVLSELGFQGWLSFEVFNKRLLDTDMSVPEEMAQRASKSWRNMAADLHLNVDEKERQVVRATL